MFARAEHVSARLGTHGRRRHAGGACEGLGGSIRDVATARRASSKEAGHASGSARGEDLVARCAFFGKAVRAKTCANSREEIVPSFFCE